MVDPLVLNKWDQNAQAGFRAVYAPMIAIATLGLLKVAIDLARELRPRSTIKDESVFRHLNAIKIVSLVQIVLCIFFFWSTEWPTALWISWSAIIAFAAAESRQAHLMKLMSILYLVNTMGLLGKMPLFGFAESFMDAFSHVFTCREYYMWHKGTGGSICQPSRYLGFLYFLSLYVMVAQPIAMVLSYVASQADTDDSPASTTGAGAAASQPAVPYSYAGAGGYQSTAAYSTGYQQLGSGPTQPETIQDKPAGAPAPAPAGAAQA